VSRLKLFMALLLAIAHSVVCSRGCTASCGPQQYVL
jgi:hypothetical protein